MIKVPSMTKQLNVSSLALTLTVHRLFADVGGERVKPKNDLSSLHSSSRSILPDVFPLFATQDVS